MGSGLVKIPVGSALFYVIKFGIIGAILGIGVSAWRRAKLRNEPPTDYLKLALFVPFTIDFHLHYAFIFLTIILFHKKLLLPWNSPLNPVYLLFIWGFISYVINQFVEFNPLSFPLFANTFFLPFLFISLFYLYANELNRKSLEDFFFSLIAMMSFVILIQTIAYWNLHPDFRDGGVSSVHMAGAFLSIAAILKYYKTFDNLVYIKNHLNDLLRLVFILLLLFLIDAKYIIVALVCAILVAEFVFNFKKSKVKYISFTTIIIFLGILVYTTNQRIILSILSFDDQNFRVQNVINDFKISPRGQLLSDGLNLPVDDPIVFFLGAGPGTFLSRSSNLRLPDQYKKWVNEFDGPLRLFTNQYRKIIVFDSTWVQKKYLSSFERNKHYYSSVLSPNGGLLSFYYEFGIVGLIIMGYVLWHLTKKNKQDYNFNASFGIVLFIMIIYLFGNWLEFTNFQILSYSLIGLQLSIGK